MFSIHITPGGHLEDMKVVKWESGKGRNQMPNFLPFSFLE